MRLSDAQLSSRPSGSGAYVRWAGRGVDGDAMSNSANYAGMHETRRRRVDSHGNTLDGNTFAKVLELRDEYRAKIAALMPGLTTEGAAIIQEYLNGDDDNEHDACLRWWLEGCINHENGADA